MDSHRLDERQLLRLIEVGRGLVAELDLEAVLQRLLEEARALTGARYAALGILDQRREQLEQFITVGIDAEGHARIGDLPRGRGVLGVLISDPKPLRLRNVGDHPRSYGFPAEHPPMSSFLGVPIRIRGEAWGNLYLTEKDSGEFTSGDEEAVVVLADWAAIAIDNARLYERTEGGRKELERVVTGLRATTEIARAVGGQTELEPLLELIAKRARALIEARRVLILLVEGDELVVRAAAGEFENVPDARVPIQGSVRGSVLRAQRPRRVLDVSTSVPALDVDFEANSALIVPLAFHGRSSGVIAAFDRISSGPEFSDDDEELLNAFAASAATAVHTAQSVAEERLRESLESAEQERRRWARELHDETLQGLAGLKVLLTAALSQGGDDALRGAAVDAVEQIELQIQSLRTLITELRPAALDELGLRPAIESLAGRIRTIAGLDVEVEFDEGETPVERLPEALENTVYRIVQEALTNVAKHARADRVQVRIVRSPSAIELTVHDDGIGFDAESETAGFGLRGMRERVALARGRFAIDSSFGEGTTIAVDLPAAPATPRAGLGRGHSGPARPASTV